MQVVSYPRDAPLQQQADALSKYEDASQWSLAPHEYQRIWQHPAWPSRLIAPKVDCFADAHNAKAAALYSCHWSPGCAGVNGLAQDWRSQPNTRQLLYIFPPFTLVGATVSKILREKPTCVLVLPVWSAWWCALLLQLPIRARWPVDPHDGALVPGPMVPARLQRSNPFRHKLQILLVWWS